MHSILIAPDALKRTITNRGRQWSFESIEPARTCHIVIDLQHGFMAEGSPLEVPVAREIVPNVNAISRLLRASGGLVAYTRWTYLPDEPNPWLNWYQQMLSSGKSEEFRAFAPGSRNHALWPELDVQQKDVVVDKTRFSAFTPGTCELKDVLDRAGIDTVIISGTLTNVCCESTARDACQLNYKTILVADATATVTDAAHNRALNNLAPVFADVVTTSQVLSIIGSDQAR